MRLCPACGLERRIEDFYARGGACKPCKQAQAKAYREVHWERLRAYDRQRNALPHRREDRLSRASSPAGKRSMQQRRERFVENHPLKRQAHMEVAAALRRGELRKETCQFIDPKTGLRCDHKRTEGHHEDYTKPLEVIWLCKPHHDCRHLILREQNRTGKVLPWRHEDANAGYTDAPF